MCQKAPNALALFTIGLPTVALAEVSDKMPSISELWMQGAVIGILLLLLVGWSRWFTFLGVVVLAFFLTASYQTFADPFVGPAILREQGAPYVLASYGSVALISVGLIGGVVVNRQIRRRAT